ncbi:MAG: hypothetical protein O2931_03850 [Planctomycetota bacterium]|nr:hypothetical protein [Planctomycetota bacterium]MDA1177912.1 hypothetical protein [Planctomycetota bacterium]
MENLLAIFCGILAMAFFVWLLIPSSNSKSDPNGELIDPSDARQLGLLIGLSGGSIADAAVARFALERFEQVHGRRATTKEIGMVIGLLK